MKTQITATEGPSLSKLLYHVESMRSLLLSTAKKCHSEQSCSTPSDKLSSAKTYKVRLGSKKTSPRKLSKKCKSPLSSSPLSMTHEHCPKCNKLLSISSLVAHAKKCGTNIPETLIVRIRNFKAQQMRMYRNNVGNT